MNSSAPPLNSLLVRVLALLALGCSSRFDGCAQTPNQAIVAEFGFYPINLSNLDPMTGSFKADFYVWLVYPKGVGKDFTNTDPDLGCISIECLEAANGAGLVLERQPYQLDTNKKMVWFRARGTFYNSFDLRRYPFDRHVLAVHLESPIWPAYELVYTASRYRRGNEVDRDTSLRSAGEWEIESIVHEITTHKYDTDWGRPTAQVPNQYSRTTMKLTLVRSWGLPILRLLIPLLASAIIASMVTVLRFDRSAAAVQLCIAMFLSVVAQHHAFLTTMPVGYFMHTNWLFLLTYIYIAALMLVVVTVGVCLEGQQYTRPLIICRTTLPLAYLALMTVICLLLKAA